MTVAVQDPTIGYIEDGVTLTFPVPFRYRDTGDLVAEREFADGSIVAMVNGTDFTATAGDSDAGGEVSLIGASVAGATLRIWRETPRQQQTQYETTGDFSSASHEAALDESALRDQEFDRELARAVKVRRGRTPPDLDLTDLLDGDLIEYYNGQLRRLDRAAFANKFYAGDATGKMIPSTGTGTDAGLRGDLALPGGGALVHFRQSGAGAVDRDMEKKLQDTVSVFDFMSGVLQVKVSLRTAVDADAAGITDAINTAIEALDAAGGGELYFPPGLYQLTNSNPGAANWDNNRCIYVGANNIHLRGAGRRASALRVANGGNAHAIQFGQRVTSVVTVANCSFRGFEIDGNRANQAVPTDTDNHWSGVAVSSNCESITIEDFYIHDTQYYGIGMQRTGIKYSTIRNGLIENTGDDGIDWKNDDGDGFGNVVENVIVLDCALELTLTAQKAAFDFRSGIEWRKLTVDLTGSAGRADTGGLRVQVDANSTASAIPDHPTIGDGLDAKGKYGSTSYGLRITPRMTKASNVHVNQWDQGIRISAVECSVVNFDVYDNNRGVVLTASGADEADLATLQAGTVRNNTSDGILCDSVDEVNIVSVDVRSNGSGLNVAAGSSNVRMVGGSLSGNTTNLTDNGSSTIFKDVSGFRTSAAVTGSLAIGSTGIKSLTIPHTLAVTPALNDVMLTLQRDTNVGDWELGFLWVTNADATNIYVQARVLVASATPTAVATVRAMVNAKARG